MAVFCVKQTFAPIEDCSKDLSDVKSLMILLCVPAQACSGNAWFYVFREE